MISAELLASISRHEGSRAIPYLDSRGIWTLGTGRCLETNPLTGAEWKVLLDAHELLVTLTPAGCTRLLARDTSAAEAACVRTFSFWGTAKQNVRDVLIEMCFQMGIEALAKFHEMLGHMAAGNLGLAAAAGEDSHWYQQTPERAEELMAKLERAVP